MRRNNSFVLVLFRLFVSSAFALISALTLPGQQAGGVAAAGAPVRLVRALVGAKGEPRNGTFVMTEPRATFYAPQDKEVIVYFEWEGSKGTHHCEGSVNGPGGEFASMSSFDYVAQQSRFAGFWKVPLSENTPQGNWTFESRVDGQSAGRVTFQVVLAARPTDLPKVAPVPSPAELYERATAAAIDVEKLDSHGHVFHHGSGFLLKNGMVVTSFHNIDGATSLHLRFATGEQLSTLLVAGWNRRQDWAVLATDLKSHASLALVDEKNWNIGDHCYWLDVKTDGSRILSDGQIVGLKSPARGATASIFLVCTLLPG